MTEKPDAYVVHAEIPGVRKEDIQVTIEGNQVTIAAEVKRETEAKDGERVLRSERYYGAVYRSFVLPVEIDEDGEPGQVRRRRARVDAGEEAASRRPQAHDPVTSVPRSVKAHRGRCFGCAFAHASVATDCFARSQPEVGSTGG